MLNAPGMPASVKIFYLGCYSVKRALGQGNTHHSQLTGASYFEQAFVHLNQPPTGLTAAVGVSPTLTAVVLKLIALSLNSHFTLYNQATFSQILVRPNSCNNASLLVWGRR